MCFYSAPSRTWLRQSALVTLAAMLVVSCSKRDAPLNDSTAVLAPAPAETATASSSSALSPVRGVIAAVSDTALTVTTATGAQQVHIVAPLHVYASSPSDLAHVTPNAFVGITSVKQADGSERATEIHVFPEALRGTGEGSRLMEGTSGSTMTNGSVAPSPSRMTNGAVSNTGGGTTYTVQYQGGSQTIAIPAGVTVTLIAPTETKLAVGNNVVVLATPAAGGGLSASSVMLAAPKAAK